MKSMAIQLVQNRFIRIYAFGGRMKNYLSFSALFVLLYSLLQNGFAYEIKFATQRAGHQLSEATEPVVRCVMEKLNQPYIIIARLPWERAQREARGGHVDGFFIATQNKERDEYAIMSDPLITIKWIYVVHKKSGITPGDSDFFMKRFASDIGSARHKWLVERHGEKKIEKEITGVDDPGQMMKLLVANRVDVALMNEHGFKRALKEGGMNPDEFITFINREIPAGIYFTKSFLDKAPGFLEKFNSILGSCNPEGEKTFRFYSGMSSPLNEMLEGYLKEIFQQIGYTAELVRVGSSQRAMVLANEEGDGDAIRVFNIKDISPESTENLMQIPEPVSHVQFFVFSKIRSLKIKEWASLEGYRNGARVGVKILEKNLPKDSLFLPSAKRLFLMLDQDRLDNVIEWENIGRKIIMDLKLNGIEMISPPIVSIPGHIYIHKRHQALIPLLSRALNEMKRDGRYEKINKQILDRFFESGAKKLD